MTDAEPESEPETVYVAINGGDSGSDGRYHTEECIHCPDEDSRGERDRDLMEAWGYSQCTFCAGEHPIIDKDEEEDLDQEKSLRAKIEEGDGTIPEVANE